MEKSPSIDLLKGILILLVIAGHAMELAGAHHILLWIGAGIRMPLMIGISGYLLNLPRTRNASTATLLKRYGERVGLPWVVAVLIYLAAAHVPLSWTTPLDVILRPPFHLWYIPVLLFLVAAARLIPLPPAMLLLIAAPINLAVMYGFGLTHGPIGDTLLSPDSRFLRFSVYFFFGVLMAERGLSGRYLPLALTALTLGLAWWSELQDTGRIVSYVPARLIMCLSLIALLPRLSALRLSIPPIDRIGRDSLFFYLWHPLVMGAIMTSGASPTTTLIISIATLWALSRLTASHPLLRRLLGSAPPPRPGPIAIPPRQAVT